MRKDFCYGKNGLVDKDRWRIRNRRRLVISLQLGIAVCLGVLLVVRWSGNDPLYEQVGTLKIGSEIPGVRLLVMKRKATLFGFSAPRMPGDRSEIIVVSNPHALVLQKNLRTLNDLKGCVSISTKEAALRYVRLQTSPYLIGVWQPHTLNRVSFEVVGRSKPDSLFDYGYVTNVGDEVASWTKKGGQPSGFYGEVSPADFKTHGFTQPQVHQGPGDFEIKRWLIVFRLPPSSNGAGWPVDGGDELQFVREIVKKDGEYHRYIIMRLLHQPLQQALYIGILTLSDRRQLITDVRNRH